LLPPRLGRSEVVEREDVEALDVVVRLSHLRRQPLDDLVRTVATRDEEPPEEVLLLLEELRRLADAEPAGDAHELLPVDRTGDAHVYRQVDAAVLQLPCPVQDDGGVEDDLGLDV